jgi:3-hydroxy-9,10-secoandrosta-1,3,5(10)-triene-9,17-dione monooxygenase reductase component
VSSATTAGTALQDRVDALDPAYLRQALGHYPTGVSVVTGMAGDGTPLALVIGSFTSVSLDPPIVGFLPMRNSFTWQAMSSGPALCINVLGHDQIDLCNRMSARTGDRFEAVSWSPSRHGVPMLDDAILQVECEVTCVTEAGDHWFVQCSVNSCHVLRNDAPLLFHRGKYCSLTD